MAFTNPEDARAYAKRYREKHKEKIKEQRIARQDLGRKLILEAKSEGCKCGEKHPAALDFHHVRGPKLFCIGAGAVRSIASLEREIAKCEVMCANCHRKLHADD